VPLGVREEGDPGLGSHLGEGHDHPPAELLHAAKRRLGIVRVDVEGDVTGPPSWDWPRPAVRFPSRYIP
jgi:hypothetical protein